MDLERVDGDQKALPLSVGMVACGSSNCQIVKEFERVILYDIGGPKVDVKAAKFSHRMYYEEKGTRRRVMKMGGKGIPSSEIASVHPKIAAMDLINFLEELEGKVTVLFHGEDEKSLFGFLREFGVMEKFKNIVTKVVDTRGFFKMKQMDMYQSEKHNMETIVKNYTSDEVKKQYQIGQHSAKTDAWALSQCCSTFCKELEEWFEKAPISNKASERRQSRG